MASIETRHHRSSPTTYRVKWLTGRRRGGETDSETFEDLKDAKKFKSLIEAHSNVRPDDDVMIKFGFGYLVQSASEEASDEPARLAVPTLEQHTRSFVADLVNVIAGP